MSDGTRPTAWSRLRLRCAWWGLAMVRGGRGGRAGGPDARWPRATAGALLSMTFVSGLVDAVVFLAVGHLFVAMVTGNIMFLGFTLAGAPGHSAALLATAVAGFFVGAVIGAPPRRSPPRRSPARRSPAWRSPAWRSPAWHGRGDAARPGTLGSGALGSGALGPGELGTAAEVVASGGIGAGTGPPRATVDAASGEDPAPREDAAVWAARRPLALTAAAYAGLLVISLVITVVFDAERGRMRYAMIAVLALAMGMQNAAGRRLAMPDIPTNVLTTQLTMIAADGWRTRELGRSTRRRAAAPVMMFSGALVGAATYRAGGVPVPLALASALAVVVALEVATGRVRPP
ncbi:YoaK family protein [Pseudofrankia sp. BMG5.37]|uniref:YoaK family protein n=1 Tax=Pseudofrankia sp. BMG5.37 TaxID=3050035 RepID=UPI00289D84B6|nr:YoaK family protein [Pseudofrankia sp. BMG5.37]